MRFIFLSILVIFLGCGKEAATDPNLTDGRAPIAGSVCENAISEAEFYLGARLEQYLEKNLDIPEDLVGASFSLRYTSSDELQGFKKIIEASFDKFDKELFGTRSVGVTASLNESVTQSEHLFTALLGIQTADSVREKSIVKDLTKTFAAGTACEISLNFNAAWKYTQERTSVEGTVALTQRSENDFLLPLGRLYFTRLGPGNSEQKFAVVIKDGNYIFTQGIPAGNYQVELNEPVSPNHRILNENLVIKPVAESIYNFITSFPCRWNVFIDGKVEEYEKKFIFWGTWEERLSGNAFWSMMPIASIDGCYSKLPYEDSDNAMRVYNYRYNLRTDITGFASSPNLKIYKDTPEGEFKMFLGIELFDNIDFGNGKTDYLTIVNSCENGGRDSEIQGCYLANLGGFLKAGQAFTINANKEIDEQARATFSIRFEPVF